MTVSGSTENIKQSNTIGCTGGRKRTSARNAERYANYIIMIIIIAPLSYTRYIYIYIYIYIYLVYSIKNRNDFRESNLEVFVLSTGVPIGVIVQFQGNHSSHMLLVQA